jgi:SSS family solute:Na+ symporter
VLVARWALVFGFLASTGLALCMKNIVDFVRTFLPLTMTGLAVIILLGRFWKRSTWQGALAALLVTPAVTLGLRFFPIKSLPADPVIPATIVGIIAHVVVSLLTPPARLSFQEVADAMTRERSHIEHEPHGRAASAPEPAAIKANVPL